MGGPEISERNNIIIEMHTLVEYFVIEEGEISFVKLVDSLYEHKVNKSYIERTNNRKCNNIAQYIKQDQRTDMSKIPSIYTTNTIPQEVYAGAQVFLETQRGCKYRCQYCFYHKNLKGVTYRDINSVKQEISFLLIEHKITFIRIIDPTFSSNLDYAKNILSIFVDLKKRGYCPVRIMIEYDYHDVDEEFVDLVSQLKIRPYINNYSKDSLTVDHCIANGSEIVDGYTVLSGIGIQSFNNDALKAVSRKPIHHDEIEHFFNLCKEYNIILKLDMILGLPKETTDTYLDGLNKLIGYIEGTDHYFQPAILMVLPETTLASRSKEIGLCFNETTKIVYKTNEMNESDIIYCAKITGLVYRIINSPLRILFYDMAKRSGKTFIDNLIYVNENIHTIGPENDNIFQDGNTLDLYDYIMPPIYNKIKQDSLSKILLSIVKE